VAGNLNQISQKGLESAPRKEVRENGTSFSLGSYKHFIMIPSRIHGLLDYLVAVFLIVCPWIFGFADGGAAQWTPIVLGIATIIYSALTNYELGISKLISFRTHLFLDLINGIILATSPWIFGFHLWIYLPHLILGLMELAVVAMSSRKAFTK
jgi:SPW repeat-containing protein